MKKSRTDALRGQVDDSLGQKLLKTARLFNQQTIAEISRHGHSLRESHTRLFPHLDFEGTRLTDLAARAGITKQSAQQRVDELIASGYLKRKSDPLDGRAKLIVPTRKGLRGVSDGLAALAIVEKRVTARVGKQNMSLLDDSLDAILGALEEMEH